MMIQSLGHFSKTSKMPCPSYSLSAFDCITTDPICLKVCYAKKHHYNFKNVKDALAKNKNMYMLKDWVKDFVFYIDKIENLLYFRWFDSGDLPSILMLEKICEIADQCPNTLFWLPTRRADLLIAYYESRGIQKFTLLHPNLVIRLSGKDINEDPNYALCDMLGIQCSSVVDNESYTCNAKDQGGKCQSCRKCWDQNIREVKYYLH